MMKAPATVVSKVGECVRRERLLHGSGTSLVKYAVGMEKSCVKDAECVCCTDCEENLDLQIVGVTAKSKNVQRW